jgi:hypothetical protein
MAIDPDVGCRFLGTQSPPPLLSSVRCLASCGGCRPRAERDIAIDRVSWLQAVNGRVGAMGTASRGSGNGRSHPTYPLAGRVLKGRFGASRGGSAACAERPLLPGETTLAAASGNDAGAPVRAVPGPTIEAPASTPSRPFTRPKGRSGRLVSGHSKACRRFSVRNCRN